MATIKKSKKRFIIPICIVLVVAIVAAAVAGAVAKSRSSTVALNTISTGDINENVSLTGDVTAGSVKEYKVGTVATVKEVFVEVGDEVEEGELLATFDVSGLDSQIAQLQTSYDTALQNYNASKANKENAEEMLDLIDEKIEETQDRIEELENGEKKPTTTKARPTYTIPTTQSTSRTTRPTSERTSSSTEPSSSQAPTRPSINTITEALIQLNETLTSISDDLDTIADMSALISGELAQAIADGELNSDVIAERVGDAIARAIVSGMIDSAKLLVESGAAADMVEAAVAQIDFEAIARGVADSDNIALTAAEIQLASLTAQRGIYKAQTNTTILEAQRTSLNSTKLALDTLKEQKKEMGEGWKAAFDGTITKVDITPNSQTTLLSAGITLENLDNMTATVSLSEYDVHKVRKGMSATIKTAYGLYQGEVTSIAPTATGGSDSSVLDNVGSQMGISGLSSLTAQGAGVECKITIFDTDANIIPGFDAEVEIQTGSYKDIPIVPIESIVLEKEGTYVYLYNEEDSTVTKTKIETGAVSDSAYEVTSGLQVGDRIIAIPSADYEEDTFKIKVQ